MGARWRRAGWRRGWRERWGEGVVDTRQCGGVEGLRERVRREESAMAARALKRARRTVEVGERAGESALGEWGAGRA